MQLIHRARHLAAEFFHQRSAAGFDVFRLVAEKAGGLDRRFDLRQRRFGKTSSGAIFFEQLRGDQVYALVRALRREDGGDEQLQRIFMVQLAMRVGISALQRRNDFLRAFPFAGKIFA